MKLLIINQRMDEDDAVLGIYVEWVREFARQCQKVNMITQWDAHPKLPKNTRVYTLGKELGLSRPRQLLRFFWYLARTITKVDAVFVHMIPLWAILASPLCMLFRKPCFLFFAHKHVNWQLRLAHLLCTGVFASVPGSISLKGKKIHLVGQGIPKGRFRLEKQDRALPKSLRMITVGRLTERKDYLTIVRATKLLKAKGRDVSLRIIGPALVDEERRHQEEIVQEIRKQSVEGEVTLTGPIPNKDMSKEYHAADVLVNAASKTGADKVVFEAALSGCIPITCDPALAALVGDLTFIPGDELSLAKRLSSVMDMTPEVRFGIRTALHKRVAKEHVADAQVKRILTIIKGATKGK